MIRINTVGRLGNEFFQYAACRSIAESNGYGFFIGQGKNYHFGPVPLKLKEYFDINLGEQGKIVNNFYEGLKGKTLLNNKVFDKGLEEMTFKMSDYRKNIKSIINQIPDNTLLHGFYKRFIYFEEYKDSLLEWFPFKEEYDDIINKFNVDDYCYVHFRGTDFNRHFKDKEFYLVESFYKQAIKYFNMNKYVIVTDDVELGKQQFHWMEDEGIEYHIIKNLEIEDFYTLTRAKYYIGSYSSFAEWAGYLNIHKHKILFPYNVRFNIDKYFYPVPFFKYLTKNGDKLEVVNL